MVYLLIVLWILSVVLSFVLGCYIAKINIKFVAIQEVVENMVNPKPLEEPSSQLIDPLDPVAEAIYERDKIMKELNP